MPIFSSIGPLAVRPRGMLLKIGALNSPIVKLSMVDISQTAFQVTRACKPFTSTTFTQSMHYTKIPSERLHGTSDVTIGSINTRLGNDAPRSCFQNSFTRHFASVSGSYEADPLLRALKDVDPERVNLMLCHHQQMIIGVQVVRQLAEVIGIAYEILGFRKYNEETKHYEHIAIPPKEVIFEPEGQPATSSPFLSNDDSEKTIRKPMPEIFPPLLNGTPLETFTILNHKLMGGTWCGLPSWLSGRITIRDIILSIHVIVAGKCDPLDPTNPEHQHTLGPSPIPIRYILESDLEKIHSLTAWLLKCKNWNEVRIKMVTKQLDVEENLRDLVMPLWENDPARIAYLEQVEMVKVVHPVDGGGLFGLWREIVSREDMTKEEKKAFEEEIAMQAWEAVTVFMIHNDIITDAESEKLMEVMMGKSDDKKLYDFVMNIVKSSDMDTMVQVRRLLKLEKEAGTGIKEGNNMDEDWEDVLL